VKVVLVDFHKDPPHFLVAGGEIILLSRNDFILRNERIELISIVEESSGKVVDVRDVKIKVVIGFIKPSTYDTNDVSLGNGYRITLWSRDTDVCFVVVVLPVETGAFCGEGEEQRRVIETNELNGLSKSGVIRFSID